MKKIVLFLQGLLFCTGLSAQNIRPVAQKVVNYQISGKSFAKYDVFSLDTSKEKQSQYAKAATGISVLQLKKTELQKIVTEKPEALEMSFPYEGGSVTVEMVKHTIFAEGFNVNTDKGHVDYKPGVYYQGIVKGDNQSVVAFSFFNDDVVGVASQLKTGNIVLGKAKDSDAFVSYNDSKLTGTNPFVCGFDELAENMNHKISFDPASVKNTEKLTDNCVRIYFEVGYGPYTQNGSNVTTTNNWLSAMFNNIKTLYNNDNINVALSETFVWTSTDPYSGQPGTILGQFRSTRTSFNGDVAQLIRNPATTSIAYLDALCSTYKYSYSGVNQSYQNVPTYSWNIEAMTHEIGHNLGSPHTHACAWNGNNTAIDGCGPASGNNEGCNAPLPTDGGTIMSYCHLVSSVGINFAKGFGPQPGALIRSRVNESGCLGTNCTTSCTTTVSSIAFSNLTKTSVQVTITDAVSSTWKYKVEKFDGTVVATGNTSSKTFNVTGLSENTYYKVLVGTDCSGPGAFQANSFTLTDADWCNNILFTDTGGVNGNYAPNQDFVKTFYPSNPGSALKMTFTQFNLEAQDAGVVYDYMTVYNGTSTAAPIFPGGNKMNGNTIPGPFTATNPQGAITVVFHSDPGLELAGWQAVFSCQTLGVNDTKIADQVQVSPNPTKGLVNITASDVILSYEVTDVSGRILTSKSHLNSKKEALDLSSHPSGTYVVTVKTGKEVVTKKVIKY